MNEGTNEPERKVLERRIEEGNEASQHLVISSNSIVSLIWNVSQWYSF